MQRVVMMQDCRHCELSLPWMLFSTSAETLDLWCDQILQVGLYITPPHVCLFFMQPVTSSTVRLHRVFVSADGNGWVGVEALGTHLGLPAPCWAYYGYLGPRLCESQSLLWDQ